jgi:hypothetical protein
MVRENDGLSYPLLFLTQRASFYSLLWAPKELIYHPYKESTICSVARQMDTKSLFYRIDLILLLRDAFQSKARRTEQLKTVCCSKWFLSKLLRCNLGT